MDRCFHSEISSPQSQGHMVIDGTLIATGMNKFINSCQVMHSATAKAKEWVVCILGSVFTLPVFVGIFGGAVVGIYVAGWSFGSASLI